MTVESAGQWPILTHGNVTRDNLVSCAGLVPVMTLAEQTDLAELLAEKVRIPLGRLDEADECPVQISAQPVIRLLPLLSWPRVTAK